jgi:hypothetical protein
MDTIQLGNIETLYPLVYGDDPEGFVITRPELYDPDNGQRVEEVPATMYETRFLVPVIDFPVVKTLIQTAFRVFEETNEVTQTLVVVTTDESSPSESGNYLVFWVSEVHERLGDKVLVTLKGYGEPDSQTIAPGQTFTVTEGATTGTILGTVRGAKPGLTLQSRPDIPFAYDSASGVLSVAGKLDFETTDEWTLTIGGQDVTVWVLDTLEDPLPVQSTYTFYLEPDTKPGTVVGTIEVEKQGDTGKAPVYAIASGNTGGWAIDSTKGDITYLGSQPLVDGQILGIVYGGTDPLTVTLRVMPASEIVLPIVRFNLPATLSDGMLVGLVGAEGVQASITDPAYSITDNKLYVADKRQAVPGLTELTLDLKGQGRQGTQQVYVTVAETPTINEFWLAEDTENGGGVGQVELPSTGAYALTPTTVFGINSGTGEILVTNSSALRVGNYLLTITKGTESITATVKVYAVITSNTLELTAPPATLIGTTLGTVQGLAPFTTTAIAPYSLNSTTGAITLAATPPAALSFTVTDAAGDTTQVTISLEEAPDTGDAGFIGAVYPGFNGQAVATRAGVVFSVGSIGFGQGSLNTDPDNLGSVARNTEGVVVASKMPGLQHGVSGRATKEMYLALKALWLLPLETPITVSTAATGEDYICTLVNFKRVIDPEGISVSLELRSMGL